MFYSHQLLAKKQPLGQIWMAATMHGKFNRKKLSKLNIISICEEILNPQVPMALRLSGILMEGVVIIYEKKVKLLQDDASRLLVEINQAWKVIPAKRDPTLLPKRKVQANQNFYQLFGKEQPLGWPVITVSVNFGFCVPKKGYKDVTLPEILGTLPDIQEMEIEEIEESTGNIRIVEDYPQTMPSGYFTVNLDDVDIGKYFNKDPMDVDPSQFHHQADPEDITLFEPVAPYQSVDNLFDRFERFDIEGDDETTMNFAASHEHTNIPSNLIPSPPQPVQPATSDENMDQQPKDQADQHAQEKKEPKKRQPGHGPLRRKPGKRAAFLIDEQIIIPGPVYQTWLQDTSDIVSPRGGRKKKRSGILSGMKIAKLMELPPTVLSCGLIDSRNQQVHYPKPLLELWNQSLPPSPQSGPSPPSGNEPPRHPPKRSSPPSNELYNDQPGFPFEDYNSGFGSESFIPPTENPRAANFKKPTSFSGGQTKVSSPGYYVAGDLGNSYHSSGSDPKSDPILEDNGRPSKKRNSSARYSVNSLPPVLEDKSWEDKGKSSSKLARIDDLSLTLDNDLFVETGPTQTQIPILTPPVDPFTDAIKRYLKTHFDSPGTAPTESLNELAHGMTKTKAAQLFYQTCVLATRSFVNVQQLLPYGDILISRGAKM